jgi:hypothetical protein
MQNCDVEAVCRSGRHEFLRYFAMDPRRAPLLSFLAIELLFDANWWLAIMAISGHVAFWSGHDLPGDILAI